MSHFLSITFLPRDVMTNTGHAVVCLSVRLSVRQLYTCVASRRLKHRRTISRPDSLIISVSGGNPVY